MNVGFVGLGKMGVGMATNLLQAGHALTIYNRSATKGDDLVARGATRATDLAAATRQSAVVTMLADDPAVEAIAFAPNGICASLPRGALHVSCSTISIALAKRLAAAHAEAGQLFVSAPVFGRPEAAAAAKLFIVAAGSKAALAAAKPLFDVMGQRTFEVAAEPERANLIKLSGNFLIASMIESLGEAFALATKGGVEASVLLDVLTSSLFTAPVYKLYGGLIAEHRFEPAGFAAPLGQKDIRLALAAADGLGVPLPIASLLRDRFLALIAQGGDRLDWSAIAGLAARDAGLPAK